MILKWFKRFRSAITGLFITKAQAEADPKHSVGEKVRRK